MIEELFVKINGIYKKVDIKTPSGIVLSFKSTLLNDLSQIESSKSYTFELPITSTNKSIFGNIDDIRSEKTIGEKYDAYFVYEGVTIVDNAYLYVSSINEGYSAVLTWNVIKALQKIHDNDIKLNELWQYDNHGSYAVPNDKGGQRIGYGYDIDEWNKQWIYFGFSNTAKALCPYYASGIYGDVVIAPSEELYGFATIPYPLPVVPIPYLIDKINEVYGCQFDLYEHIEYGGTHEDAESMYQEVAYDDSFPTFNHNLENEINEGRREKSDIFNLGALTCIKSQLKEDEYKQHSLHITGLEYLGKRFDDKDAYVFLTNRIWRKGSLILAGNAADLEHPSLSGKLLYPLYNYEIINFDGTAKAWFKLDDFESYKGETFEITEADVPLQIKQNGGSRAITNELASINGIVIQYETINNIRYAVVEYNFSSDAGRDVLSAENCLRGNETDINNEPTISSDYGIYATFGGLKPLKVEMMCDVFPSFAEGGRPHLMNPTFSLPDITCFEFIRSLFYVAGGFPKILNDGRIVNSKYSDLFKNIKSNVCYNWSGITIFETQNVTYNENYAQNNYYLTETDDEKVSDKITKEGFLNSKLNVEIHNELLNKETIVYKAPYCSPFVLNPKFKDIETGSGTNYWNVDDVYRRIWNTEKQKYEYVISASGNETKPFIGVLRAYSTKDEQLRLKLDLWKGFGDEYVELKKMFENQIIIKINAIIPIVELVNIEYTIPVYIEESNSYFAIVNIDFRCDNGISEVTLMKINL